MDPNTELCAAFSSPGARAVPWGDALRILGAAEVFWLSTVRSDGRPNASPILGVWVEESLSFSTGNEERKAKNLSANASCTVTTGRNTLTGLDVVIEGEARLILDKPDLHVIADSFEQKYQSHFTPDGTWGRLGDNIRKGDVLVYRLIPRVAFGFGKGNEYTQTRWTFT